VRPRDETLVLHSPSCFVKFPFPAAQGPCFPCQASRYLELKNIKGENHHTPTCISHEHSLQFKMAENGTAPSGATDAVLKPSDPVPEGAMPVKGLDFNDFKNVDITAAELVANMAQMGFQASSIGQAAKIVDGMVCDCVFSFVMFPS
jgi:hypothetical protein